MVTTPTTHPLLEYLAHEAAQLEVAQYVTESIQPHQLAADVERLAAMIGAVGGLVASAHPDVISPSPRALRDTADELERAGELERSAELANLLQGALTLLEHFLDASKGGVPIVLDSVDRGAIEKLKARCEALKVPALGATRGPSGFSFPGAGPTGVAEQLRKGGA